LFCLAGGGLALTDRLGLLFGGGDPLAARLAFILFLRGDGDGDLLPDGALFFLCLGGGGDLLALGLGDRLDLLRGGEPPLLLRARRTFLAGDGLTGCDPDLLLRRLPGLLLLDGDL